MRKMKSLAIEFDGKILINYFNWLHFTNLQTL